MAELGRAVLALSFDFCLSSRATATVLRLSWAILALDGLWASLAIRSTSGKYIVSHEGANREP